MKNNLFKVIWSFTLLLGVLLLIYLIISPIKHPVAFACYDVDEEITSVKYSSKVNTIINVTRPDIFRIIIFLGEANHDNLNISLTNLNDESIIFNQFLESYTSSISYFEFPPLNVGEKYLLTIEELDGDVLELPTLKSNGMTYLQNDSTSTIKLGATYRENYNFGLWYPLFVFIFEFTLYPFVWKDEKHEK